MIYPTYLNGIKVSGSGVPHVSLTQAEYDALSVETKNNGTIYFITDAVGGSGEFAFIQNGDCYSTEERMIGCWIDGKPLYQKTWVKTVPNQTGFFEWSDGVPSDLETVVETSYSIRNIGEQGETPWYTSASVYFDAMNSKISFYFIGNYNAGHPLVFTAKYTKSSDRAGSGSWTPNGMPAIHYSTEEQIIGTWVDRSTLYEKTYANVLLTNGAENIVDSNFGNDKVLQDFSVRTKGMANTLCAYNSSISDTLFENNGVLKYYISKTGSWWNALNKVDITIRYTKS